MRRRVLGCSAIAACAGATLIRAASSLPRSLLASGSPDCGLAFQPCCAWGDSCSDPSLTCIAREGGPLCEPCGTPFSQPCPTAPYCEVDGLIPTTRASRRRNLHVDACTLRTVCHARLAVPRTLAITPKRACLTVRERRPDLASVQGVKRAMCSAARVVWSGSRAAPTSRVSARRASSATPSRTAAWWASTSASRRASSQAVRLPFPGRCCRPSLLSCSPAVQVVQRRQTCCEHVLALAALDGTGTAESLAGPVCGGMNDPPCMETSLFGPVWSCDEGFALTIPRALSARFSTVPHAISSTAAFVDSCMLAKISLNGRQHAQESHEMPMLRSVLVHGEHAASADGH